MTLTVDLILSIVAALVLGWWLGDHFGYLRGEDDGKQTEKDRWVTYRREQEARKRVPPPEIRAKTGPRSLRQAVDQSPELQAWAAQQRKRVVTKTWTDAADIAPVLTAHTDATRVPFQPQPPRTSGTGTQTLPRLTDTGELRKLEADWFEEKRREQAVWSHEFAERCEADRKELLA